MSLFLLRMPRGGGISRKDIEMERAISPKQPCPNEYFGRLHLLKAAVSIFLLSGAMV